MQNGSVRFGTILSWSWLVHYTISVLYWSVLYLSILTEVCHLEHTLCLCGTMWEHFFNETGLNSINFSAYFNQESIKNKDFFKNINKQRVITLLTLLYLIENCTKTTFLMQDSGKTAWRSIQGAIRDFRDCVCCAGVLYSNVHVAGTSNNFCDLVFHATLLDHHQCLKSTRFGYQQYECIGRFIIDLRLGPTASSQRPNFIIGNRKKLQVKYGNKGVQNNYCVG